MLSSFSVHKPYTVVVAVVIVILLGIISFANMSTDLLPSIDLPYVVVITAYPGASPEEVELRVTQPLEQALATTSNVQNITSTSSENASTVILEFAQSTDMDSVLIEMSGTLDMVEGQWGDDVGTPMVVKLNPDAMPIMIAAIDAEGMDTQQVTELTDDKIVPQLDRIAGVASVQELGLVEEEYEFVIDPEKVRELNDRMQGLIDEKIDDAKRELDDAKGSLEEGQEALTDNTLSQTEAITQAQMQLTDGKLQLASAETEIAMGKMQLQQMIMMAQQTIGQLSAQLGPMQAQRGEVTGQIAELEAAQQQLQDGRAQIEEGLGKISEGRAQLEAMIAQMEAAGQEAPAEMTAQLAALDEQQKQLEDQLAELNEQEPQLTEGLAAARSGLEELDAGIATIQENIAAAQAQANEASSQMAALDQAQAGIDAGRQQLEAGSAQVAQGAGALASGITGATAEIASAQAALQMGTQQMDAQETPEVDMSATITPALVAQIISAQNFSMPAGYVQNDGEDYLVRVGDRLASVEELENLVLLNPGIEGMEVVTVADVGTVQHVDNADDLYAKINGNDGIVLIMQKQSTFSTADVAHDITDTFEKLQEENDGLHITTLMNQGSYIDLVVQNVLQNLLYGAVLAVIVLFIFLRRLAPTVIVAVSIPISVVFALVLMYFSGVNLNLLSMAGLALGVGMLVDNSIVVIENIFRLRAAGMSRAKAAIQGASQVGGAIAASTLTTICVFLPIVFTDGISKELFTDMGLTITYSLLASLMVALTLVPTMSASMLRGTGKIKKSLLDKILPVYGKAVNWCVRHKAIVLVPVFALFIWCVAEVFVVGIAFMPTMDAPQITVDVEMPPGATFNDMAETADIVTERIQSIDDVETVGAMDASSVGMMMGLGGSNSGRTVSMYVTLKEDKTKTSSEIADEIRRDTEDLDCEVTANGSAMDMSAYTGSGIQVRIEGTDMDAMREAAADIADILKDTEGTMDISDGMEQTTPEIRVKVDRNKAMEHGLTTGQVFQAVSSAISEGTKAGTIKIDDFDIPIVVADAGAQDMTPAEIADIELTGTVGQETSTVRLGDISEISEGMGLNSIQRENQVRYMHVTAQVDSSHNVGLVSRDAAAKIDRYTPPEGVGITVEGENSTIMDAMDDLLFMLGIAIGLIYLIMVAQFQSLKSPFIVMFTIPLAFTGGLLALYMTGTDISIIAMVGFLMLSGIIVNNGIVFVDYINKLRLGGTERRAAIVEAGQTRLRPILMTALTTIFGLVTLALGIGTGADMLQPMAIVTIGGLVYGTFLTLFVVPCMYDMFNKKPLYRLEDKEAEEDASDENLLPEGEDGASPA